MTTGTLHTKLAGVTKQNPDGGKRQNYIRRYCHSGQTLIFKREPNNRYDPDAVGVWILARAFLFFTAEVQIGYLKADLSSEMARHIDRGGTLLGEITEVTGTNRQSRGVNILLTKVKT